MRLRFGIAALCLAMMGAANAQERPVWKETKAVVSIDKPKAAADRAEPLSEKEQSELAKRAEEPGTEVAGGALSNLHLTYIVIALATAVIVLVLK